MRAIGMPVRIAAMAALQHASTGGEDSDEGCQRERGSDGDGRFL
jgi:hypothetical protein